MERPPRPLVPADMAVDALLDARSQAENRQNRQTLEAIDEMLARISHRQRLTPDEASALSLVAERSMQIIQLQDVVKRIGDLEKKVGSNNEG